MPRASALKLPGAIQGPFLCDIAFDLVVAELSKLHRGLIDMAICRQAGGSENGYRGEENH